VAACYRGSTVRTLVAGPVRSSIQLAIAIALGLISTLTSCNKLFPLPSDARMEANLRRNRPYFEALLRMFAEDSKFSRISPDFTTPPTDCSVIENDVIFCDVRWPGYRRIFDQLGLKGGIARGDDPPSTVAFVADSRGLAVAGDAKGYLYSPDGPPSPLITSLDHGVPPSLPPPTPPHTASVAFKQIDKDWYIFYMSE
jgi:hypothetical protein